MKKIICLLLCAATVFFCFSSCKRENVSQTEETTASSAELPSNEKEQKEIKHDVVLGYYSHKSLNPFKTNSVANNNITKLIFDPLFKLDNNFRLEYSIAESFNLEGRVLSVEIKEDVTFSDGSLLDTDDIVYSYNFASDSPLYKERLSNITSASSQNGKVVFTLATQDPFAANCLDFPIVKAGSGDNSIPTGSGRYIPKKHNDSYILKRNDNYSLNEELEQEQLFLYDINETQTPLYLLQIGELSFVYNDFSDGEEEYKINANTSKVNLNNLVFLSFNSNNEIFSYKNIKKAISKALDLNALCGTCYNSMATACTSPFNPAWSEVSSLEQKDISQDIIEADRLLEESGYIYQYKNNKYRSKDFEFLELNMIVNKENPAKLSLAKEIASSLRTMGIGIKLEKLDFEEYKNRVESGEFDMYIGEIKLSANMSLSPFFSSGGNANYGIDLSSTVHGAYSDFLEGKIDLSTFIKVFDEDKPFIPICYRTGLIYYSRQLKYEGAAGESDVFENIYSWSF